MRTGFITDHHLRTEWNASHSEKPTIRTVLAALLVSLCITSLSLISGCAKPDRAVEARKAVEAGYLAEDAGTGRKDVAAALSAHAPDCVMLSRNGTESPMSTNTQVLTQTFSQANVTFTRTSVIQDLTMNNPQGTEAIVNVKHHAEMTMVRPEIQREMTVYIDSSDRDFWVKTPSGWLIKRAKLTDAKTRHSVKSTGG